MRMDSPSRATRPLLLGLMLAAGCGPGPLPMDKVRLAHLASRYTAAWNGAEPTRVAGYFAPDGSLTVNDQAPAVGRDAIADVAEGFMRAFPDLRVEMDSVVLEDDGARYHWTFTGTNNGPGGGGRRVEISGYERWTFAEGDLIATSRGHFDTVDYRRQLTGDSTGGISSN